MKRVRVLHCYFIDCCFRIVLWLNLTEILIHRRGSCSIVFIKQKIFDQIFRLYSTAETRHVCSLGQLKRHDIWYVVTSRTQKTKGKCCILMRGYFNNCNDWWKLQMLTLKAIWCSLRKLWSFKTWNTPISQRYFEANFLPYGQKSRNERIQTLKPISMPQLQQHGVVKKALWSFQPQQPFCFTKKIHVLGIIMREMFRSSSKKTSQPLFHLSRSFNTWSNLFWHYPVVVVNLWKLCACVLIYDHCVRCTQ